jgi:hypothetical protein
MRKIAMPLAIAILLSASAAAAQPANFFVGKWYVADPKVCKAKPGEAEGLITYTAKKMFGYESRCDIARATPQGNRIALQLNCSGEGEKYKLSETVEMVAGDKLQVTGKTDGRTFKFAYSRCP